MTKPAAKLEVLNNLSVELAVDAPRWHAHWPACEDEVAALTNHAIARYLPTHEARLLEVSVVLSANAQVQALNKAYRGKDRPTNVLSFPSLTQPERKQLVSPGPPVLLGDVVLAIETVETEAQTKKVAFGAHASHLLCHGVLHLLGFDHEEHDAALEMEMAERTILAAFGLPDPYAGEEIA